jgi:hypothetical protein
MSERRVSQIVSETGGFSYVGIETQVSSKVRLFARKILGNSPGYLRHLEGMCEPIVN